MVWNIVTLWSPLKLTFWPFDPPKGKAIVFQSNHPFLGAKMLVSGSFVSSSSQKKLMVAVEVVHIEGGKNPHQPYDTRA